MMNQTNPLKIKDAAPAAPPPLSSPVHRLAGPKPRSARMLWSLRMVLLLAVSVSALLIYWAYAKRLQPVTAEQRDKTRMMSQLADEVEQLRFKWGPKQIEEMNSRYAMARETLFNGEEDLSVWTNSVRAEADMRVLEAQVVPGAPQDYPELAGEVSLVPVTVDVRPNTIFGATNTAYARILNFANGLMNSPKRFDIVELAVDGNSNSVAQAKAVMNLFTNSKGAQ